MKNLINLFLILTLTTSCNQTQNKIEKYPSGKIKAEFEMKNDRKNGVGKYYYENGQLNTLLEFRNDSLIGTIKEYYENGTLYRETDCKTLNSKVYSRDGQQYYKGKYESNKFIMNGLWEDWNVKYNFKSGDLTFVNDVKNGPYTAYRQNGTIEAKGYFDNGALSDSLKIYDEKNNLQEIQIWKADKNTGNSNLENTIYLTDVKSDGTVEVIDGNIYRWDKGKKVFLQKLNSK